VRIASFAHGGDGLAREAGQRVTFVPDTVPGDLVEVDVLESRRDFERGRLVTVVEPGPARREPPCPETASCGGCQWQHVAEAAQAAAARELLVSALRRTGHLDVATVEVAACASGAVDALRYRQRARFHVRLRHPAGLGFHRRSSHEVHVPAACLVLEPELEALRLDVARVLPEVVRVLPDAGQAELQLDLPAPGRALARLEVTTRRPVGAAALKAACGVIASASPALRAVEVEARLERGRDVAVESTGVPRVPYRRGTAEEPERFPACLAPGGFMQASRAGNLLLVSRVLAACAPTLRDGSRVLELFAGNGNLTLPLAAAGGRVTSVESDARAVLCAQLAAREAGLTVDARAGEAGAVVRELAAAGGRLDLIVLDPPRTGARAECSVLAGLQPRAVVYVSCDAVTFARDAAVLVAAGLSLVRAEPLLLFPQTAHFETVAVFAGRL
jgi:23S rRNA (uracil1939-C5)-methyltransferase